MIKELKELYKPSQVLVVYDNEAANKSYIEIHPVKNGEVKEGRPLKKKTIQDLLISCGDFKENRIPFRGIIPENIIYYNCNADDPVLIWFEPAAVRNLIFEKDIPSGSAAIPPLLFCYKDEGLSVHVTRREERKEIKVDDVLYNLPLPNIYANGTICMGSVDMEIKTEINCIEQIVELCSEKFWNSTFTEYHIDKPLKDRNAFEFWKKQIKDKLPFPMEVLEETKMTLKKLWKE